MYNVKEVVDRSCKDYYEIYVELSKIDELVVEHFMNDYVPSDEQGILEITGIEIVETLEVLI